MRELKNLHAILKDIYGFENDRVKPHRASGTRWIAHKFLIALENMLDKFGLYMQHFENIIADTQKKTDKATLEGKRRQLEKADIILVGALLFDLLEPARGLSLNTQEERVNIIKMVDSIDGTRKRYEQLLNKVLKDPNTVLELPRIKGVLSKVTSEQSINDVVAHKYQGITLKYYPQAKAKVVSMAPKVLRAICKAFDERFGALINDDEEIVQNATVLGDELIHSICKVVNKLIWRIPDNATELCDVFDHQLSSIQKLYSQFEKMEPLKNIAISDLQEQYLQVIEHAIKYYKVQLFEPLDMWKMLYASDCKQ